MKDGNIFAYTEMEYKDSPGFISINRKGGKIMVTVRSPDNAGAVATCELPSGAAKELTFVLAGMFAGSA